jgi:serpin B
MERIMDGMSGEKVDILLPRFELEQNYKLEETLPDMGMPDAFHNGADFSGMTEIDYGLFIDQINHKAFVEVNEAGTEAAAATAVIMTYNSTEPEPRPQFNADHPFLFFIRQNDNGNILFLGTVADPTV